MFIWNLSKEEDIVKGNIFSKTLKIEKPSNINSISISPCGSYLSLSNTDSVFLYKNNNFEFVLYSSTNNEGSLIHFNENNDS